MAECMIENIVTTADINQQLPLQTLSVSLPNTEYNDEDPVLIFRFEKPKRAVLLTQQGTISCTGTTSLEQGRETIYHVIDILKQQGIPIDDKPDVTIQNYVISLQMDNTLDLDLISRQLQSDQVVYNPDTNPWIEYLYDEHISFIICSSGKIVCTGTSTIDHAYQAIDMLSQLLE